MATVVLLRARALAIVLALGAAVSAAAAPKPPTAAPSSPAAPVGAPDAAPTETPQAFIERLHARLDALVRQHAELDALHGAIAVELDGAVDYAEMARLTLPERWGSLQPAQRGEFTALLKKMVQNTYVRRFKPGSPAELRFVATRVLASGRAEVHTTVTVRKTTADVHYQLVALRARWAVSDLTVDGASQVQSYRKNFTRILDKEGWDGLIARMRKAAAKKPG